MDPAKETPICFAVRLQGVMLGRHEVELVAVKHAGEILSAQVTELTESVTESVFHPILSAASLSP